jgi:hypothetical protein
MARSMGVNRLTVDRAVNECFISDHKSKREMRCEQGRSDASRRVRGFGVIDGQDRTARATTHDQTQKKVKGGEPMINLGSQGCAVRDESGHVLCPSHPIPRSGTCRRRSGGRAASGAVVRNVNVPLQNHGRHLRCQFRDMELGKATNKGLLSSLTLTTLRLKGPM